MHFPVSILINVQIYGKIVKVATIEVVVGRMALNDHNLYHNYTYIHIERIRAVVSRVISVKVKPTYGFASIEIIDEKEKMSSTRYVSKKPANYTIYHRIKILINNFQNAGNLYERDNPSKV